jgi:hypothetical protein
MDALSAHRLERLPAQKEALTLPYKDPEKAIAYGKAWNTHTRYSAQIASRLQIPTKGTP